MKKSTTHVSILLFAAIFFLISATPNCRAKSVDGRTVIRKKIGAPSETPDSHIGIRETVTDQKRPALKPKSDHTVPIKSTSDALTASSRKLSSRKTQPVYNSEGKIDPFLPLFREKPRTGGNILVPFDTGRTKSTALEKIDLSQLTLTGIILAARGNMGLVQEASGKGYVISKGTYIGTRGGKVTRIQKGKVIVEEKMKDVYGNILIAKQELKLNKPE